MSYNDSAFYVAETNRKNRLKASLKPFVGTLSGRNAPLIKSNDKTPGCFERTVTGQSARKDGCTTRNAQERNGKKVDNEMGKPSGLTFPNT
jgi:hypothetical protein